MSRHQRSITADRPVSVVYGQPSWGARRTPSADVACGPGVAQVLESVRLLRDAGYGHLYFHQIRPGPAGFLEFWRRALPPALADLD